MRTAACRSATTLFVLFVLAACIGSATAASSYSSQASDSERVLVKFRAGTSHAAAAVALSRAGAHELRVLPRLGVRVAAVRNATAIQELRRARSVEYAERDADLQPQELLPNDPSFPQQFAVAGGAWGWYRTHTTQAWDITTGSASVTVAILDTGLKPQGLVDYDGQLVAGWNVVTNSSDVTSSAGTHGTYVAGVVGLALNNERGNAGYCPGCKVMPIQVGSDSGAYVSNIASGLVWAADHGARVANISFGGPSSSSTLTNAVSYARSKGVVVTAAAGNANCDCPTYPAATPGVVGVAGTSNTDAKQGDSNFGSWVKVAAPEGNMTSWPSMNGVPGYAPVGGTSLAAPVVAGIAGLLFSAKPALSGSDVEQALEASAVPVGFRVEYGRVDALSAMQYIGASAAEQATAPLNGISPRILAETNGPYDAIPLLAPPQPGQMLLRGQGSWTGQAPLSLASVQWERCDSLGVSCTVVGTSARYTVAATDAGYALRLSVTVKNALGTTRALSPLSLPVGGSNTISLPENASPPAVTGSAQAGQTLTASTGAWSGAPTSYAYRWSRCDAAGATCNWIATATTAAYTATPEDVGATLRVEVTATNAAGSAAAQSAPTPVVTASAQPSPPAASQWQSLTFSGSLTPKTPSRSYTVSVGSGSTHAELSFSKCTTLALKLSTGALMSGPSVVTVDAVLPPGPYTYTVSGGRCAFTLTVTGPAP